jgi:hypothetical protein
VTVGIRPEHPHAPAEHGFAARTTTVESLGDRRISMPSRRWRRTGLSHAVHPSNVTIGARR